MPTPTPTPAATLMAWADLSPCQRSVAELVGHGLTNRQVAAALCVSRHTVDAHLRLVFQKLGVDSRVKLARVAAHQELIVRR